jgi:GH15 family glucan-1,4-alpha-glucosidase
VTARRPPSIADYALLGDGHTAALVSDEGSVDWCCLPRFDSGSVFGRVLDWDRGGYCQIRPTDAGVTSFRSYLEGTMVLATTFESPSGSAVVYDCFTMRAGGARNPHRQLLRVVEGTRGRMTLDVTISARFDYAGVKPWLRRRETQTHTAVGGNDALIVSGDVGLEIIDLHDLHGTVDVEAGARARLSIVYAHPEDVDEDLPPVPGAEELDARLEETVAWWRAWVDKLRIPRIHASEIVRSALVLKALVHAPTGAVVAAPTTSFPEALDGGRNWDYRFSWIRDSQFTVRALTELGAGSEADGFRRFIERTTGGSADALQVLYGVGGERRIPELSTSLAGFHGVGPVRVGNAAAGQLQLDVYGYLMDQAWRWHERGRSPDDDYWRFLMGVVDAAIEGWEQPDCGIWEMRTKPQHFVHSKVMCWSAVQRGIDLAEACLRKAPLRRWRRAATQVREAIELHGIDRLRGVYVQAFGSDELDAACLLLPTFGYVSWTDPRMIATVDAIVDDLSEGGLIRRYRSDDALGGAEGTFVACTFWLAECLAHQGRLPEARDAFERGAATANHLGLFAEEYDATQRLPLGNFPQGLSHLSHISAALALADDDVT